MCLCPAARCTYDTCDAKKGCVHEILPDCCPGGCDDQNECTADSCDNGYCQNHIIACDDNDE